MQTLKKLGEQTGLSPKPPSYKCRAKSEFKTTNNYLEFSFPHSVLVFFGGVGGREQDREEERELMATTLTAAPSLLYRYHCAIKLLPIVPGAV